MFFQKGDAVVNEGVSLPFHLSHTLLRSPQHLHRPLCIQSHNKVMAGGPRKEHGKNRAAVSLLAEGRTEGGRGRECKRVGERENEREVWRRGEGEGDAQHHWSTGAAR